MLNWSAIMGLQFENLVLSNRNLVKQALDIGSQENVLDNPHQQRKTRKQLGCQINYLIKTRFNTLYVCEIKYSRDPIPASVIDEVESKIEKLKIKKNFSVRPVLIHCNTVFEKVKDSDYFAKIIDFTDFI